jgi:hypothetical protein
MHCDSPPGLARDRWVSRERSAARRLYKAENKEGSGCDLSNGRALGSRAFRGMKLRLGS